MHDFIKNIIHDLKVDLTDEFDQNFERKAFFDKVWEGTKFPNRRGSLLMRSGKLRRSIKARESKESISWSSSLPFATLQNEGGEIEVTAKMKRFFWAMFYKADGATTFKRDKDKNVVSRQTERNKKLTAEAAMWKALALQKVGAKMKIKQRQFIGDHPQVHRRIEHVVDLNMKDLEKTIFNSLKR
jgi:phage gpG-like protein